MSVMKLQFASDLPHQRGAIEAVSKLFEGQPLADSSFSVSLKGVDSLLSELGFGNRLVISDNVLLDNLRRIQEQNDIAQAAALPGRNFAVEMETGTGKTYVYLRTAFELKKLYGFQKFVIVVPSVPIREGVLHSIETMRDHFQALYGTPFDHFVYDSKKLGVLRAFATANSMQLMVINIQAFNRDVSAAKGDTSGLIMYQEREELSGRRPIDFLQATCPVVIIDEPQKMQAEASAAAIERLNPLCTLRYSATYESPAKVYRLGPIEALDQKLVKRIEVASVREDGNLNDAYLRLLKVDAEKQKAEVEINVGSGADAKQKKLSVKSSDDLAVKSEGRQEYQSGFIIRAISFETGNEFLELSGGQRIRLGEAVGGLDDEVMRAQVYETVREHLEKERRLGPKGIKVLSLIFIDRVANYRVYNEDASWSLGKIGQWIEEALKEFAAKPAFKDLITEPIGKLHDGYFSIDRKGAYRDTSGETKDDDDTYNKIMRAKEQLLSLDEPLRFIVSHSALREGWDNPNVFQICTLNETRSVTRKRQELGRGLRLAVNQQGERVHDEQVNRLTVIANESYKSFAESLQKEYEDDAGVRFGEVPREAFAKLVIDRDGKSTPMGQAASTQLWDHFRTKGYLDAQGRIQDLFDPKNHAFQLDVPAEYEVLRPQLVDAISRYVFENRIVNKRDRRDVKLRKQVLLDPEFAELWARISQRTRYRVGFATDELVAIAVERLRRAPKIEPVKIEIDKRLVDITRAGVDAETSLYRDFVDVGAVRQLPDLLAYLQNETELTRHTLVRIIVESGRAEELRVNPQAFVALAVHEVTQALHDLILKGIEYEKIAGQRWEMRRLEEDAEQTLVRYLDRLYQVQNPDKTPFDAVEFDSEVERSFARELDHNDQVKFFLKLPSWFTVDTPLGTYNPDWAIMIEGTTKLYLVRETKSTIDEEKLRATEARKLDCGRKHFAAIGVDYEVTTSLSDVLRKLKARGVTVAGGGA